MSTQYYVGSNPTALPQVKVPRYRSQTLVTRDELVSILQRSWGVSMSLHDVDMFIRNRGLKPVGYVPMPPQPVVTDDMDDVEAKRVLTAWVDRRSSSRRTRERFDIHGVEAYVPSVELPSANDSPAANAARAERINNLKTEV